MQFFHHAVKQPELKIASLSVGCETAEKRATLDVARDSRGWYKVRAAIDLQQNCCGGRGVTKPRLRNKISKLNTLRMISITQASARHPFGRELDE
jgi:hypothetical protein